MLLFSRAVLLPPVIEQAALKTRKLFPHQLLHINLDVNLLSLYVTYLLSLYFTVFFYVCYFLSWIMSRSPTSQIITITTKSDDVIVEDWSRFIYFYHERSVEQKRDSRVFLPTSWVFWPLSKRFTTEESTVKASLIYLFYDKESVKLPTHCFLFPKTNFIFTANQSVVNMLYSHKTCLN